MEDVAAATQSFATVRERLLADRRALLDLGTRNRLINVPLRTAKVRTIELVDERSEETYRLLTEGKGLTFLPGRQLTPDERAELAENDSETGGIPQPDEVENDERGVAKRHSDAKLQTRLTSEGLQKRLFDIWYDARTLEEEQGVNVLYLAFGLLRWFEADTSEVTRHAPLVLFPVRLDRTSAADRFTLRWRNEPASPNLSLQAKMNAEFGLKIEDFGSADDEALDLPGYMVRVADTVAKKARWDVMPDAMVLGFFSFAKFLMYRDLDPENWPNGNTLDVHPVVTGLLSEGFGADEPVVPDGANIDAFIAPAAMNHVVDADSSQAVVIEEVVRGKHLVVKGPPGTGKSQTITNVIAAAAAEGRKVLFVAEKMAALDVVHRRLREVGLSALALELHSSKANKRAVLEELKRTRDLASRPTRAAPVAAVIQRLTDTRDQLNNHAHAMHAPHDPSGLTPYQLIGHLVRVREDGRGLPGYGLDGPKSWIPADVEQRADLLEEVAQRLALVGDPSSHPWRGVGRDALDPSELEDLVTRLDGLLAHLRSVTAAAGQASELFGLEAPQFLSELETIASMLGAALALPEGSDRTALSDPIWARGGGAAAEEAVRTGHAYTSLRSAVERAFTDAAWSCQLGECRAVLATKGRSPFRYLSGAYRRQVALLRSYLKVHLPKTLEGRLLIIDGLLAAQEARRAFEDARNAGPAAFGWAWNGEHSNWTALQSVVDWWSQHKGKGLPSDFLPRLSALSDPSRLVPLRDVMELVLPRVFADLNELASVLQLDPVRSFGVASIGDVGIDRLRAHLEAWRADPEQVTKWIAFADRCRAAAELGLGQLVEGVLDGKLGAGAVVPTFERAYYEAVRTDLFAKLPVLKRFDGEGHARLVQSFRALDLQRMVVAREQIALRHLDEVPRSAAGIGPVGVLNGEFAKKRNHLPIRQLLAKAGPVIQQLKPIFMMSPLSVAQFLKPGAVTFDLLVVDEASQIEPVDALGAVARCRQVVVVGDERQLPPTRFFTKLTSDIEERDEEDEATFQARDAESILDLCLAKGMPHRMLNWHYRSKHQSLIAVSNREFYDNRLFIVPSPFDAVAGMGLKFNHLPQAHYDRGNTRTNPIEAKTVADRVIRHALEIPEKSLGVATFSVAQRQLILKELELLRRLHPETEDFFNQSAREPFFVKNLENIQGDERDVIFISVGYGRTSTGYLAMSFGPLNSDGGERRLNVLISRAKLRCEVFSNITGDDIDLERVRSRGVTALKLFLTFAQTGKLGITEESGRGPDSVFEEQVADKLRACGHDVKNQIGSAGFFVDIAVADPEKPGRFVLGIECDGAQYHSSRSARDRDRLRQRVLEDHGWIVHRIWSTDWYLRPNQELAKVERAIETAKADWRERDAEAVRPKGSAGVPLRFSAHREDDVDVVTAVVGADLNDTSEGARERALATPYVEADAARLAVRTNVEPHETPLADMARYIAKVVEIEGPIHENEIVTRIRSAWGLGRAGSRIRDAVLAGLKAAERAGQVEAAGVFWSKPGQTILVRDRSSVLSPTLRKPEHLPSQEIQSALLALLHANFGAERDELILATARLFGFAATSAPLRRIIETALNALATEGLVQIDDNQVTRTLPTTFEPATSIAEPPPSRATMAPA
jgi:very-short-patch-repair endonuclease